MAEIIRDDILYDLEQIARLNDITIIDVDQLSESTPDSSIEKSKFILMNPAYEKSSYEFRLAHEMSHIIYGSEFPDEVYQFSPFIKRGEELLAHRHAIEMLMNIEMPTSPMTFMEYFNVPSWLLDEVTTKFNQLA